MEGNKKFIIKLMAYKSKDKILKTIMPRINKKFNPS